MGFDSPGGGGGGGGGGGPTVAASGQTTVPNGERVTVDPGLPADGTPYQVAISPGSAGGYSDSRVFSAADTSGGANMRYSLLFEPGGTEFRFNLESTANADIDVDWWVYELPTE
jgi:hypothetical protein